MFYGAAIDGKVLWGKFKGDVNALIKDLTAKIGIDVEVGCGSVCCVLCAVRL
jgi:hypothetical protein